MTFLMQQVVQQEAPVGAPSQPVVDHNQRSAYGDSKAALIAG
jgi:hypothetical protein